MDFIFDLCVAFLYWLAELTGTTYKQINVLLFVLLHPVLTVLFGYQWWRTRRQLQRVLQANGKAVVQKKMTLPQ